jgi:hypothetical protein
MYVVWLYDIKDMLMAWMHSYVYIYFQLWSLRQSIVKTYFSIVFT